MQDLNRFYTNEPALYELDFDPQGFEWIDFQDADKSVLSFLRRSKSKASLIIGVCNFTPVPRNNYRVGVPREGIWKEARNSDAKEYGGSGHGNLGEVETSPASFYGKYDQSLSVTLPPLSIVIFSHDGDNAE